MKFFGDINDIWIRFIRDITIFGVIRLFADLRFGKTLLKLETIVRKKLPIGNLF